LAAGGHRESGRRHVVSQAALFAHHVRESEAQTPRLAGTASFKYPVWRSSSKSFVKKLFSLSCFAVRRAKSLSNSSRR
jgi:hypothetical protein